MTRLTMTFTLLCTMSATVAAQQNQLGPLVPLDAPEQTAVITELGKQLRAEYVFPATAESMIKLIKAKWDSGSYNGLTRATFAQKLTADLQSVSHDKHLRIRYSPEMVAMDPEREGPDDNQLVRQRAGHFGFARTEILPGNVALLELHGFEAARPEARDTAIAALKRLSGADALIVDLRANGGGDPNMVALISSALWPRGETVHLNDLYFRPANQTTEFFTNPTLDVPRITGPVYTVTSSYTFSAAEEFTYNLKQLKRATQVGETTGGGANPGGAVRLADHFTAFMPSGRAVNPITKTNWEGVGNVPEIPTSRDSALVRAYREALVKLAAGAVSDVKRTAIRAAQAKLTNRETVLR